MAFFCQNATEESLKEIAKQMNIYNTIMLLKELHAAGSIDAEEYKKRLESVWKHS